jgi:hypothetical protein
MQNKPNFPDDQMYVTVFYTKEYENMSNWAIYPKQTQTKPISPHQTAACRRGATQYYADTDGLF